MSETNQNKFLRFFDSTYDYEKALKAMKLKQSDVESLRKKVKSSKYVPKFIVDKQLLLFMNGVPDEVEKSAKVLETFYKMKQTVPEFFANRDLQGKAIQDCFDHQYYIALPVTPDNCIPVFGRLSSFELKHYVFDDTVKTFILMCEAQSYSNGPQSELILIFDVQGSTFSHMLRPSLSSIRKLVKFLQEGVALNIKAIHVLNTVPFFDFIIGMLKSLARSELFNKVHFHPHNMDYEKFSQEHVPKSHLPSDYGGDLESVETLHKKHRQDLMELREFFLVEEQQANFEFDQYLEKFGEDALKVQV